VLALAGTLSHEELGIVRRKIREQERGRVKLALDLADLRGVDREGCSFLISLPEKGVELRRIPQFIAVRLCQSRRRLPGSSKGNTTNNKRERGGHA